MRRITRPWKKISLMKINSIRHLSVHWLSTRRATTDRCDGAVMVSIVFFRDQCLENSVRGNTQSHVDQS